MQFSLRTLLAAVAAVGTGAALWVAEPSWQVGLVEFLLLVWVPASAAILAANSTGKAKAWWIGIAAECSCPSVFWVVATAALFATPYVLSHYQENLSFILNKLVEYFHIVLIGWAFAPVVGLLCVLTHWLFIRSADPDEPKD